MPQANLYQQQYLDNKGGVRSLITTSTLSEEDRERLKEEWREKFSDVSRPFIKPWRISYD